MLKREITFTDFNGDQQTEIHYFNLTKSELVELEVKFQGGLEANVRAIMDAQDHATLLENFKQIILMSYGIKSPDGKRFDKSDEIRNNFKNSAAYDQLFMELATDENAGANFVQSLLPKDLVEEVRKDQSAKELQAEFVEKTTASPEA